MLLNRSVVQLILTVLLLMYSHELVFAKDMKQQKLDAITIQNEIKKSGARTFSDKHPFNQSLDYWEAIFDGIASGSGGWLLVCESIIPISDAAMTEGLETSLGMAIRHNPSGVLEVLGRLNKTQKFLALRKWGYDLTSNVCAALSSDDDSEDYDSQRDLENLKDREEALKKNTNTTLRSTRSSCIAAIQKGISDLKALKREHSVHQTQPRSK